MTAIRASYDSLTPLLSFLRHGAGWSSLVARRAHNPNNGDESAPTLRGGDLRFAGGMLDLAAETSRREDPTHGAFGTRAISDTSDAAACNSVILLTNDEIYDKLQTTYVICSKHLLLPIDKGKPAVRWGRKAYGPLRGGGSRATESGATSETDSQNRTIGSSASSWPWGRTERRIPRSAD